MQRPLDPPKTNNNNNQFLGDLKFNEHFSRFLPNIVCTSTHDIPTSVHGNDSLYTAFMCRISWAYKQNLHAHIFVHSFGGWWWRSQPARQSCSLTVISAWRPRSQLKSRINYRVICTSTCCCSGLVSFACSAQEDAAADDDDYKEWGNLSSLGLGIRWDGMKIYTGHHHCSPGRQWRIRINNEKGSPLFTRSCHNI